MQHGERDTAVTETGSKSANQLWGESNLWNQNQRLFPFGEDGLDQAQVDLGFAAAGNSVQQGTGESIGFKRLL
jgi:hypothetical protein